MATKVYLSGDVIVVDKTGEPPVLNIPLIRCKYTFYADRPTTTNEEVNFNRVAINDFILNEGRLDDVSQIEDSGGTPIGDFNDVKNYFATFIQRGDGQILDVEPSGGGGGNDGVRSFIFTGARRTNGAADRDMRSDDELTNQTPLVIPFDCELEKITASTTGNESWEAHIYKNGVSVASLIVTSASSTVSTGLSVSFAQGDEVRLRQENGTGAINSPRIEAFFKEIV